MLLILLTTLIGLSSPFSAGATDFGELRLRSNLGEAFKAQFMLSGATQNVAIPSCFKAKLETVDGELLANPRIDFTRLNSDRSAFLLTLSTRELMAEPAIKLKIEIICEQTMQREYTLLLDFAEMAAPSSAAVPVDVNQDDNRPEMAVLQKPAKAVAKVAASMGGSDSSSSRRSEEKQPVKKGPSRFSTNLTTHKDALKVTNEEILPPVDLKAGAKKAEPPPVNLEQQRQAENDQARDAFAKMLSEEPGAASTADELKKEQQKVKDLESEMAKLKLEFQLRNQKEQSIPNYLIVLNVVVLALLLIVVIVLVVMLRKSRQTERNTWWDADDRSPSGMRGGARQEGHVSKSGYRVVKSASADDDSEDDLDSVAPVAASSARPDAAEPPDVAQQAAISSYLASLNVAEDDLNDVAASTTLTKKEKKGAPESTFNLFSSREGQTIQIEEVSDAMQEAEFWLSINDPQRSIEIVEPLCTDDNQTTPVMWLFLLDLYRTVGDEANYNKLRLRFKNKFNTHILEFNEKIDTDNIKYLEDYEHLISKCCAFWGTNYIVPFLESLLIDDREGERVGFELPVYQDILMLLAISKEIEKPTESDVKAD